MSDTTETATDHVTYSLDDGIAVVSVDDGKANALGHATLGGIESALDRAESDEAGAVVIVGREGKFSAGFDLSVMTSGPDQAKELLGRGAELGIRLYELSRPVVLGVTGHALAMGGILLCCADVRIGAEGPFKLGLNEVRIGMPVPAFAVEVCRDRLSPRHFTRAIQLAHVHSPAEALDAGFLDELVAPDLVRARAIEVASELAGALHPGPFRMTRTTTRGAVAQQLRDVLAADLAEFFVSAP
ncbi:MAG: crotonase/enoyl-CoA hydratase family protein [Microthrixaceae bacterium]